MSEIITFIKEYDILAIFGLFISGLGVYYGRAAYHTALDIFNKGLQIDKRKIFLQIGLEIKLSSYLADKDDSDYANLTLVDFFSESQYVNKEIFDRGNNLIRMVDDNIERLPKELGIQEKREKLCRV